MPQSKNSNPKEAGDLKRPDNTMLYRMLIENSMDIIFTFCPPGILTFASPGWTSSLGHPVDQVIGKSLKEFLHPEDIDICRDIFDTVILSGKPATGIEYRLRHADRSWRWFSSNMVPMRDDAGKIACYQVVARDITEDRIKKTGLWEDELIFTDIFQSVNEGIAVCTISGQLIGINKSLEKILGVRQEDVIGQNILNLSSDILPGENGANTQAILNGLLQGHDVQGFEVEYKNQILEFNASVNKGTRRLTMVIRDITDRKRIEEEINLKNMELNLLNAQKDKFLSIIAHDLRSPFQTFLGFISLLSDQVRNLTLEETEKIILSLNNSANRLYKLLEDLLEWSRLQRGLVGYSPQRLNLRREIQSCLAPMLDAAQKKSIDVSLEIQDDLSVFADSAMFDSLLRNLVYNAVKFTPRNGQVSIAAIELADSGVEVSIKDTGIGMNKEMLSKIFDLNLLPSRPGTEGEASTGLGLLLCKDYVEKHGGRIWAESEEGKGSTFYFTLSARKE
jgi:PAS domain S-box-containing protein